MTLMAAEIPRVGDDVGNELSESDIIKNMKDWRQRENIPPPGMKRTSSAPTRRPPSVSFLLSDTAAMSDAVSDSSSSAMLFYGHGHRFGVNKVVTSCNDHLLFSAGRDSTVRQWESSGDDGSDSVACMSIMESHTDWVNDLLLSETSSVLFSCGSDCNVIAWRYRAETSLNNTAPAADPSGAPTRHLPVTTWRRHTDYVKVIAGSTDRHKIVSGGLDGRIIIWDTTSGTPTREIALTSKNGQSESVYSVAMAPDGNVIFSGSVESVIRVWDCRGSKICKLKGHRGNIRALSVSDDGMLLFSGGSVDNELRVWDVLQRKCIESFQPHSDSIWTLTAQTGRQGRAVFSGSRDGTVSYVDPVAPDPVIVCQEKHSILSIASRDASSLWVATTNADIKLWKISALSNDADYASLPATCTYHLPGLPAIVKAAVLNNKYHVMTLNSEGVIAIWNVLTGKVIKIFENNNYTPSSFDEMVSANQPAIVVPSWFTLDWTTGSLTVRLDHSSVFDAEVYACDLQVPLDNAEDTKLNLGEYVLKSLFRVWINEQIKLMEVNSSSNDIGDSADDTPNPPSSLEFRSALPIFDLPSFTRVLVTNPTGGMDPCPSSSTDGDGGDVGHGESKTSHSLPMNLKLPIHSFHHTHALPDWVSDCLIDGKTKVNERRIAFTLRTHDATELPQIRDCQNLKAPPTLRVAKVYAFVMDGIKTALSPSSTSIDPMNIELMIGDVVVPPSESLQTVLRYYSASHSPVAFVYQLRNNAVGK